MHPLLLKFLTPEAARAVTQKAAGTLDPDEQAFADALGRFPEYGDALRSTKGKSAAPEVQQMLLLVGSSAAAHQLQSHPGLGEATRRARAALEAQGASPEETDSLLSVIVLEEALGSEEDPDTFDEGWVRETLETVPALAALTEVTVHQLLDEADAQEGAPGRAAAAMLLQAAWEDGPQPVTVEHLEEAAQGLADLPKRQRTEAVRGLERALPRREG